MKKYLLPLMALCLSVSVMAQEAEKSVWDFSGVVGLNASATGLVNWAAGGIISVNGVFFGLVLVMTLQKEI